MVFLGSSTWSSAQGLSTGQVLRDNKIEARDKYPVLKTLFKLCEDCQTKTMSSIPFSAFSAGRIRETQQDMKVSKITKTTEFSEKYFNTAFMEPSPLKYNSKLMNSIWGFYNRYSPHNVKKVNDVSAFSGEMQQSAAISSLKNDTMLNLPAAAFDKVWAAINVSQSH